MTDTLIFLADVGGTNARFALTDEHGKQLYQETLAVADYATPIDAINTFLAKALPEGAVAPKHACIAIAGPTLNDELKLSNGHWRFSCKALREAMQLDKLVVMNDFPALALSIPKLNDNQIEKLFGGEPHPNAPKLILGPGTGLGVSALIPSGENNWVALSGEGGHATWRPFHGSENVVFDTLINRYGHASFERVASGTGLRETYQILANLSAENTPSSAEISRLAMSEECPIADHALRIFCRALGLLAGNLALALGAHGGIYLAGGIPPKIKTFLMKTDFEARVTQRGRFQGYMENIPVFMITDGLSALSGCYAGLHNPPLGSQTLYAGDAR